MRRMLDVDIPGKRRRQRPCLRWKDACKRDMTQAGLKEDNSTNRAAWWKKIYRRPQMTGQARDEEEDVCAGVRIEDTSQLGCRPRKDLFVVLLHLNVAFLRLGRHKLLVRSLLVNLQQMETLILTTG